MSKLISFVIPVHNEESNIVPFFDRLAQSINRLGHEYEFIFVDDGSMDDTLYELYRLSKGFPEIKILELSKNFGKEAALSAGLHVASGDAVIMLDADMQHPPELVPVFLHAWEEGADTVVGIRNQSKGAGFLKRAGSKLFYAIMRSISDTPIIPNSTDFRLLDRAVVDAFKQFSERNRITRGLIDWLGFRRTYIDFTAPERIYGVPAYTRIKLFRLAVSSFVSHSLFPLKIAGYLGLAITTVFGVFGLFVFVVRYVLSDPWSMNFSGPAQLAIINVFLIGVVLMCLGLIALYIGSIHEEVSNRPLYVVRSTKNLIPKKKPEPTPEPEPQPDQIIYETTVVHVER